MRYGVNFLIWTTHFTEEHIPLLAKMKAAGFDGVELPMFNPDGYPGKTIRRALEDSGLGLTFCSIVPGGMSLVDADATARANGLEHIRKIIYLAAEMGCETVAGPIYSPVGYLPGRRRTAEEWKNAIESYHTLAVTLDECKVDLAIEPLNRFETFFLNTTADGVALCEAVNHPRIGLLVDTFHCNVEEKDIAAAYRMAGRHLKHVHTCENDRGIPGSGHVEWGPVFEAIRSTGYNNWLTIESFGFNMPDISAAAAIWRDLAPTPESIAVEGVKFLRSHFE
ncbi:MAG: sugar phosphate isomerase/epimerase [Acidobacteria bacterium]|nr:sugar phosphate isomerase/epimerase [Acidobacteriota bacterium]